jgi:hypothetical protein
MIQAPPNTMILLYCELAGGMEVGGLKGDGEEGRGSGRRRRLISFRRISGNSVKIKRIISINTIKRYLSYYIHTTPGKRISYLLRVRFFYGKLLALQIIKLGCMVRME